MTARGVALVAAAGCIVAVVAQDVAPAWAGFHTWQYAAALGIGMAAVAGYALSARKGEDGDVGRRLVVAMIGALVVAAAGTTSGLLGPDTERVARAPGVVAPLPAVGAAAFFPIAAADQIARGDTSIALRRRDGSELVVEPGRTRYLGSVAARLVSQTTAYVEARDDRGRRLTVTQPTNPSFLSPVLFFPQLVPIAGKTLPADAFAAPALHRQIKAFYFAAGAASSDQARAHGLGSGPAVLFAVDDDAGRLVPGGIGFVTSGSEATLGDVRLRVTLGTYPALEISAVPSPAALWFGGALFTVGLVVAFGRLPRRATDGRRAVPDTGERA